MPVCLLLSPSLPLTGQEREPMVNSIPQILCILYLGALSNLSTIVILEYMTNISNINIILFFLYTLCFYMKQIVSPKHC